MGVAQTGILLKSAIEAALYDLRKNEFILEDIFSDLANDPLSKDVSGWKFVKEAIEWFKANEIPVFNNFRIGDTPVFPCITIELQNSTEKINRTNLGDIGQIEEVSPEKVNKQIRKVIDDFSPIGYNSTLGQIAMPLPLSTDIVSPGMYLVSIKSGHAYEITKLVDDNKFLIAPNILNEDFTSVFIAPRSQLLNVHREMTYFAETYTIGVHTQSRLVTCTWLTLIMQYLLLRYKESFLEARGFEISTFNMSQVFLNQNFAPENVFSSYFTLSGDMQCTFIKFVAQKLDKVTAKSISIIDGPKTPDGFKVPTDCDGWHMEGDEQDINLDDIVTLGDPGDDNV